MSTTLELVLLNINVKVNDKVDVTNITIDPGNPGSAGLCPRL